MIATALSKKPNSPEWLELEALCSPGKANLQPAQKALSLRPNDAHIAATCALVAYCAGNSRLSQQMAQDALRLDKSNARACAVLATIKTNEIDGDAAELFAKAIKLSPSEYDVNQLAAAYYEKMERLSDAEACLKRMIKFYPKVSEPLVLYAKFKRRNNETNVALTYFDRALQVEPGDLSAVAARAKMLSQSGRTADASHAMDKWAEAAPDSPAARFQCGKANAKTGKTEKAIADFDAAIRLANRPAAAELYLPQQHWLSSREYATCWMRRMELLEQVGKADQALTQADAVLSYEGGNDSALALRQRILMKKGRYLEAIRDLDKLVALDSDVSDWYKVRAVANDKVNRKAQAARDREKANHIDQFGF